MIKIISDTTCCLFPAITKKNDLYKFDSVTIGVTVDDTNYLDEIINDNYKSQEGFIDVLKNSGTAPKSFAPSPEAYYNAIIKDDECDTVFIVCLTSALSGTYNSAMIAKSMCEDENINKEIYVIDSKSAASGLSNVVLKVVECIENNETNEQIYNNTLKFANEDLRFYLVLKSLNNLEKNGRISPSVAKLAKLMGIRPICKMIDGTFHLTNKPRGNKAYKKAIEIIKNDDVDYSTRTLIISNIRNEEAANMIKDEVLKFANFKNIIISNDLAYLHIMYNEDEGINLSY